MKNFLTATVLGYLVSSSIQYVFPPDGLPEPISICRYSDGVVLTVPGIVCPASD